METRFEHDFGDVRVHSDASAAGSADSINARAYTLGNHVAFADGEYRPGTPGGDQLLAHELAHTVQQGGNTHRTPGPIGGDLIEGEADRTANQVVRGGPRPSVSRAPTGIARSPVTFGRNDPGLDDPFGSKKKSEGLRFAKNDEPATTERLLLWAIQKTKEGLSETVIVQRILGSYEFNGPEAARGGRGQSARGARGEVARRAGRRLAAGAGAGRESATGCGPGGRQGRLLRDRPEAQAAGGGVADAGGGRGGGSGGGMRSRTYWGMWFRPGARAGRYRVVVPPISGGGVITLDDRYYYRIEANAMAEEFRTGAFADEAWEKTKGIISGSGFILRNAGTLVKTFIKGPEGAAVGEALEYIGQHMEDEVDEIERKRHGIETPEVPLADRDIPDIGIPELDEIPGSRGARGEPAGRAHGEPVGASRGEDEHAPSRPTAGHAEDEPTAPRARARRTRRMSPRRRAKGSAGAEETLDVAPAIGANHEVQVTPRGIELCSPRPCPLIRKKYGRELKENPKLDTLLDDLTERRRAAPKDAALREQSRLLEERLGELKARNDLVDAIPEPELKARARAAAGDGIDREQLDAYRKWIAGSKSKAQRQSRVRQLEQQAETSTTRRNAGRMRGVDPEVDAEVEKLFSESELPGRGAGELKHRPIRPDVDEIDTVGAPKVSRDEAMEREALDPHNRSSRISRRTGGPSTWAPTRPTPPGAPRRRRRCRWRRTPTPS